MTRDRKNDPPGLVGSGVERLVPSQTECKVLWPRQRNPFRHNLKWRRQRMKKKRVVVQIHKVLGKSERP